MSLLPAIFGCGGVWSFRCGVIWLLLWRVLASISVWRGITLGRWIGGRTGQISRCLVDSGGEEAFPVACGGPEVCDLSVEEGSSESEGFDHGWVGVEGVGVEVEPAGLGEGRGEWCGGEGGEEGST